MTPSTFLLKPSHPRNATHSPTPARQLGENEPEACPATENHLHRPRSKELGRWMLFFDRGIGPPLQTTSMIRDERAPDRLQPDKHLGGIRPTLRSSGPGVLNTLLVPLRRTRANFALACRRFWFGARCKHRVRDWAIPGQLVSRTATGGKLETSVQTKLQLGSPPS